MGKPQRATKAKQVTSPNSARRNVYQVSVHSPYGHGIDRVQKVFSTIEVMLKRKQISDREFQAGNRLAVAHETVYGQAGGSMDFERARGGACPGQPPLPSYMAASLTISEAKKYLYPRDYATVFRVCVQGLKVEDCAVLFKEMCGGEGRKAREEAGRALRRGLFELADRWWPEGERRSRPQVYRQDRATVGDVGVVSVGGTYHAG